MPAPVGLRTAQAGMPFHSVPEVFFQLVGTNRFTCVAEKFVLRADEMAIIPRWLPHGERCAGGAAGPFSGIVVGLDPGLITFRWQCPGDRGRPSVAWAVEVKGPGSDTIARYLDDLSAQWGDALEYRDSLVRAAVVLLLRLLGDSRSASGGSEAEEPPLVRRCREIIQADYSDPRVGVGRLARDLRCTTTHLSRLFRARHGVPLNVYMRAERLRQAQTLLADPSLNISEVAWACGFSSPNYFIRCYRAAFGASPARVRARR